MGSGTSATLTCKITGVTEALTVTWLKSNGEEISTGGGFTVNQGKNTNSGVQQSAFKVDYEKNIC